MPLKFSIVTPSFQHGAYLEQTLQSVLSQNYVPLEYLVIDGGSTDNTLDILRRYEGQLSWVSEPDGGQADAINKGFRRATGDIFAWLNSDDYYAPGALQAVSAYFTAHPEAEFLYGDAIGQDENGVSFGIRLHTAQRQQYPEDDLAVLLNRYCFIVQPAAFWRASLWRRVGELDAALHYTMDYEYWMRAARVTRFYYLPMTFTYERLYGGAKTGSGGIKRLEEIEAVALRHGGSGLPQRYVTEAAAYYTQRALRRPLTPQARRDLRRVQKLKPSLCRYLAYMGVMTLLGSDAIPSAWLWLNRWRNRTRNRR